MKELTLHTSKEEIFGCPDALVEPQAFFESRFCRTQSYDLLQDSGNFLLLIGEKGTGKSALLRMAALKDEASKENIVIRVHRPQITETATLNQKIDEWKAFLSQEIVNALQDATVKRWLSSKMQDVLSILAKSVGEIAKTKYGFRYDEVFRQIAELTSDRYQIRIYIDDLDAGYQPTPEKNGSISALFTAIREMQWKLENLACRIALRYDVYHNVMCEDESADKIGGSQIFLKVTNHEIMTMLTTRVMRYLDPDHVKHDYSVMHQSRMMQEMARLFDLSFPDERRQEEKPMYRVLMTYIRRRPRDAIKLCGMAWDHAKGRGATKITAADIRAVLHAYSQYCRENIISEYKKEFRDREDDIHALFGALKPTEREWRQGKSFLFTRADLIKKVRNGLQGTQIFFANGKAKPAKESKLAAFLYRANVVVARREEPDGSIRRVYYMEEPDLLSDGADHGFQFEVHPSYRASIYPEKDTGKTIELESDGEK